MKFEISSEPFKTLHTNNFLSDKINLTVGVPKQFKKWKMSKGENFKDMRMHTGTN